MPAKEWVFVNGITRSSISGSERAIAKRQIRYWRDIPAQVKAYDCNRAVSRQLPERYQLEIDRLAMQLGLAETDEYLNQWLGVTIDMFPTSQAKPCSNQLKSKKILPAG